MVTLVHHLRAGCELVVVGGCYVGYVVPVTDETMFTPCVLRPLRSIELFRIL